MNNTNLTLRVRPVAAKRPHGDRSGPSRFAGTRALTITLNCSLLLFAATAHSATLPAQPPPITKPAYHNLSLNGVWTVTPLPLSAEGVAGYRLLRQTNAEPFAAQVPGEIHLDLMRAGRMEDPDVSDNARLRCRWPEQFSWWYRTQFDLPPEFLKQLRQRLIFDGIDLYGQVFVNGELAGASKDAFAPVEFEVKRLLHAGTNELVVRVTSGTELVPSEGRGEGFTGLYAVRSFDQRRFLRKPAYAYGWDWCDPLPNIGLWRDVRLEGRSQVVIHHLRLDTEIHGKEVALTGEITLDNLHPWSGTVCTVELELDPPEGPSVIQRLQIPVQVGHSTIPCRITTGICKVINEVLA